MEETFELIQPTFNIAALIRIPEARESKLYPIAFN